MATQLNYLPASPFDLSMEHEERDKRENGMAKLCKDLIEKGESKAKMALDIVTTWLSFQGSYRISGTTVTVRNKLEATGLDERYTKIPFWEKVFSEGWNLPKYGFPDDRVCRMVFHFVYQWQDKLGKLLLDEDVPGDLKVTMLKKQIENIVFFGKNMCWGSLWRMWSLPDEPLRQALASPDRCALVTDQEGEPLTDIQGRKYTAFAGHGISSSSGDGPRPDDIDKMLYKRIRRFAEKETGEKISNKWTLVRCHFVSQEKKVRCYAFSGSKPEKQLNKIPGKFWQKHKYDDGFFDANSNEDIFVVNVQGRQLGQGVLLSVFEALRPCIERDLEKLTNFICFEESLDAKELMAHLRSDLTVVDYGEYYDDVISKLDDYNDRIKTAVTNYLTNQPPGSDDKNLVFECIKCHITVGSENKKFQPKTEGLEELLKLFVFDVDKAVETVAHIAQQHLTKLQDDLKKLRNSFLEELQKSLQQAQCGEDNVLSVVLSKMLDHVDVFNGTRVDFVAMDYNNLDGKPFCKVCDRKVRFFSILPFVLRNLGLTGKDIWNEKLSDLFDECAMCTVKNVQS